MILEKRQRSPLFAGFQPLNSKFKESGNNSDWKNIRMRNAHSLRCFGLCTARAILDYAAPRILVSLTTYLCRKEM
jgi:hypothetical protein